MWVVCCTVTDSLNSHVTVTHFEENLWHNGDFKNNNQNTHVIQQPAPQRTPHRPPNADIPLAHSTPHVTYMWAIFSGSSIYRQYPLLFKLCPLSNHRLHCITRWILFVYNIICKCNNKYSAYTSPKILRKQTFYNNRRLEWLYARDTRFSSPDISTFQRMWPLRQGRNIHTLWVMGREDVL